MFLNVELTVYKRLFVCSFSLIVLILAHIYVRAPRRHHGLIIECKHGSPADTALHDLALDGRAEFASL